METKDVTVHELMKEVNETFLELFGRTPLRQRQEDIFGEATELSRAIDWRNLKEEAGDLGSSLLSLFAECELDPVTAIRSTLAKIKKREKQYKSLGRKVKVAIFGGAFDPPTIAHIAVAKLILDFSKEFDEVWMMPCANHMFGKKMSDPEHRLAMCRLASQVDARIKVFDYEIKHNLGGETYHFCKRLLAEDFAQNQYDFSLVVGMDNANCFDRWVNFIDLEKMIRFVVVPRTGQTPDPRATWYLKPPHILLVPESPLPQMSSTSVRKTVYDLKHHIHEDDSRLQQEYLERIHYSVGRDVAAYISTHRLYE